MKEIILRNNQKIIFDKTKIMGIINMTPNSFYVKSRCDFDAAYELAIKMINDGVDIIDIGGESTHPKSKSITVDEELSRIIPIIERLKSTQNCIISVDTYNSKTAKDAINSGADIVNDISGATFDDNMIDVVSYTKTPIIITHCPRRPSIMQKNVKYKDVVVDVYDFFEKKIKELKEVGLENKIILDCGISFGKYSEHNIELIRSIKKFEELRYPILYGVSRKGFLSNLMGDDTEEAKFIATLTINHFLMNLGVDIIRVHDVKQHRILRDIMGVIDDNFYSTRI